MEALMSNTVFTAIGISVTYITAIFVLYVIAHLFKRWMIRCIRKIVIKHRKKMTERS